LFIRNDSRRLIFTKKRKRPFGKLLLVVVILLTGALFLPISPRLVDTAPHFTDHLVPIPPAVDPAALTGLTKGGNLNIPSDIFVKEKISAAFEGPLHRNEFPAQLELAGKDKLEKVSVKYTLDARMQNNIDRLIQSYQPDYAAFVAIDAVTGRVLSLSSYTRKKTKLGNLALKAMFPSASVFKIVTATAAIDRERVTPDTVISFTGADHTLYRRNVTAVTPRRWARHMTLREAFAKSVNTVFAKVGMFFLKPLELEEYARRFQFNQAIAADVPVQAGRFQIPESDPFAVAQMASGYNRLSLMSPMQGALIAAAVANDGVMMEPHLVDSLTSEDGKPLYVTEARRVSVTMSPETAKEVRSLMRETVQRGTGRKSFSSLFRRRSIDELDLGGKTGSLMSLAPRGKCDWFVGYGQRGSRKIAVAALTVNERNWKVKSSYLARSYIERYFERVAGN